MPLFSFWARMDGRIHQQTKYFSPPSLHCIILSFSMGARVCTMMVYGVLFPGDFTALTSVLSLVIQPSHWSSDSGFPLGPIEMRAMSDECWWMASLSLWARPTASRTYRVTRLAVDRVKLWLLINWQSRLAADTVKHWLAWIVNSKVVLKIFYESGLWGHLL